MENQRYMQEGLDGRRILLLLKKKLWVAVAAAVIGALTGGGIYLLIHLLAASEREFQAVSKLYLNFNCDPEDFNELSYNGYTWNDLMATDPILGYTMEMLPEDVDKNVVINATKAEILSDIRLLTITITANRPELAAQIMDATQKSLVHLGESDELFDSIEIYSTVEPQQIVWDNRTANAAVTGAVIGLAAALLLLVFYYVMDDSVYVAGDVEKRYELPVFGIFTADGKDASQPYGKEFAANYGYLCRDVKKAVLISVDTKEDAETAGKMIEKAVSAKGTPAGLPILSVGGNPEEDTEIYGRIREADGAVLAVRYGGGNGKRLERALGNLKKQDCRVLGAVIINADEKFLRLYYFGAQRVG